MAQREALFKEQLVNQLQAEADRLGEEVRRARRETREVQARQLNHLAAARVADKSGGGGVIATSSGGAGADGRPNSLVVPRPLVTPSMAPVVHSPPPAAAAAAADSDQPPIPGYRPMVHSPPPSPPSSPTPAAQQERRRQQERQDELKGEIENLR